MRFVQREDGKIVDDVYSAGHNFVVEYVEEFIKRLEELDDSDSKKSFIKEIHMRDDGIYDKDLGGTTTRVNSLLRIIKANKISIALSVISKSNNELARKKAQEIIIKVDTEGLKFPILK